MKSLAGDVELRDCVTHGRAEHKVLIAPDLSADKAKKKKIYSCLSCQKEQGEAEELRADQEHWQLEEAKRQEVRKRLDDAGIPPRFTDKTLENFKTLKAGQAKAVEEAMRFIEEQGRGKTAHPGMIFIGGNGTGKNHLANAIAREVVVRHGKTALVTKLRKLDREIKESWSQDGKESEAIQSFVDPDLLVIDEVGLQRGTDTELLHLTEVVDDRYEQMKQTILCGNVTLPEMKELVGDRIIDRFREGGRIVVFDWESWRGKR